MIDVDYFCIIPTLRLKNPVNTGYFVSIYITVHGWEHSRLRTVSPIYPWDRKDKKDRYISARLPTCNLPPSELTSHKLLKEGLKNLWDCLNPLPIKYSDAVFCRLPAFVLSTSRLRFLPVEARCAIDIGVDR